MNPSLADQLKNVKLDSSDYSRLPIREDVLVFKDSANVMKQWNKLVSLQSHLKVINRYIQRNKGEKLNDWLKTNNLVLSRNVLDKIGNHDNATGGISAYFLNLQNFYDGEEEKYDAMEENGGVPDDLQRILKEMRDARAEKRATRRKVRKLKLKDLKADGKGYLIVNVEEPEAPKEEPKKTVEEKKLEDAVKGAGKNIGKWVLIAVGSVAVLALIANSKE